MLFNGTFNEIIIQKDDNFNDFNNLRFENIYSF